MADEMTLDEYREALRLILETKLEELNKVTIWENEFQAYAASARKELLEELIEKI